VDESITMNLNEVLELDYLVGDTSSDAINIKEDQTNSSIDYIYKEIGVFDPDTTGVTTLEINNQVIEVEVIDSPKNGNYLDDWSDNKLSSRASFSDKSLSPKSLEPSSSSFSSPSRPEWTREQGSNGINVQNERLKLDGSSIHHLYYTSNAVNKGSWEISFTSNSNRGSSENVSVLSVLDQDPTNWDANSGVPDNGYIIEIRDGSRYALVLRQNGFSSEIINGSWDNDTNQHTARVTRDNNGNWQLFYDGKSVGKATDNTFTTTNGTGIGMDSGSSIYFDNFRVF
jgi:hypothetical protein